MEIPVEQKIVRQKSVVEEHDEEYRAAMVKAASLNIPMSSPSPSYGTFHDTEEGESSSAGGSPSMWSFKGMKRTWNRFVDRHFPIDDDDDDDDSGDMKEESPALLSL